MHVFNLTAEQAFHPKKHMERVLGRIDEGDVTIACWEPGQRMAEQSRLETAPGRRRLFSRAATVKGATAPRAYCSCDMPPRLGLRRRWMTASPARPARP